MKEDFGGKAADIPAEKNLMSYMPGYYIENYIMSDIQNSISAELGELDKHTSDTLKQLFVKSATWGLKLWEAELGIPLDSNKPEGTRKNAVLGKIRGLGITAPDTIKEMAELFSGGRAVVTELYDEYKFIVKFFEIRGIPSNLRELSEAIEEIKPAHLTFSYEYTWLIWYETSGYLWDEVRLFTWDVFRVQKPKYGMGSPVTWGIALWSEDIRFWNVLRKITWEEVTKIKLINY